MIVVDVNILAYHAIKGPFTADIAKLVAKDNEWFIPVQWRFEFTNVLTTMVRTGNLTYPDALGALAAARIAIVNGEREVTEGMALETALRFGISAYDAYYIALAQNLQVPCITADAPLIRKVPTVAVQLSEFIKK